MSFSVDDLVSSFSSSHIGQEATDLATLHAQLAETLFSGSNCASPHARQMPLPTRGRTQNTQPCTTPIARTPSLSSSFSHGWGMDTGRGRGNSVSSNMDDMEEDERMVEELLIPSSPTLPSVSGSYFGNGYVSASSSSSSMNSYPQIGTNNGFSSYNNTYSDPSPSSPNTNGSLFTTTDPFYIAQLQASNNSPQSQSVFAQNGRLAQSSPFALPQYHPSFHAHGQNWEHHHASVPFKTAAAF